MGVYTYLQLSAVAGLLHDVNISIQAEAHSIWSGLQCMVCLHKKAQWMSEAGIFQLTAIVEPL